jgi:hypothetical protein
MTEIFQLKNSQFTLHYIVDSWDGVNIFFMKKLQVSARCIDKNTRTKGGVVFVILLYMFNLQFELDPNRNFVCL